MKEQNRSLRKSWIVQRTRPLYWDIESLAERSASVRSEGIINERAERTRYPIRALRYWWLRCCLIDELKRRSPAVVADFGSSFGHFKRFFGESELIRWVAFDMEIDQEQLLSSGYSDCVQCDFDQEIPYASNSVDVVVFSHVVEHLPRPEFTLCEIARILRPGGVLLAGSPVVPFPVSRLRDWHHRRRYQSGKVRFGGHINAMDSARWKKLVRSVGLDLEMMHGTFFFRWSGNPLENYRWWVRLNQAWGTLLPSYAGEAYLAARKPGSAQATNSPQASGSSRGGDYAATLRT